MKNLFDFNQWKIDRSTHRVGVKPHYNKMSTILQQIVLVETPVDHTKGQDTN